MTSIYKLRWSVCEEDQGAQAWRGLHLQESFTAAPKASGWLQVHRILVLSAVKEKKFWKYWKLSWDWISNCSSPLDLFICGEGTGVRQHRMWCGWLGGMWDKGHHMPDWVWVVLPRDVGTGELTDNKPCAVFHPPSVQRGLFPEEVWSGRQKTDLGEDVPS